MEKPVVEIRNWNISWCDFRKCINLKGYAINHPVLGSDNINTSKIVKINLKKKTVETLNTLYKLID